MSYSYRRSYTRNVPTYTHIPDPPTLPTYVETDPYLMEAQMRAAMPDVPMHVPTVPHVRSIPVHRYSYKTSSYPTYTRRVYRSGVDEPWDEELIPDDFPMHMRVPKMSLKESTSEVKDTDEFLKVTLDVSQYTPEEVRVKVDGDRIVVECEHDQEGNSRSLKRNYALPKDADSNAITSAVSPSGTLTIHVPKHVKPAAGETSIPVQHS